MANKPALFMIAILLLAEVWQPQSNLFLVWALVIYFYQAVFIYFNKPLTKNPLRALFWPLFK